MNKSFFKIGSLPFYIKHERQGTLQFCASIIPLAYQMGLGIAPFFYARRILLCFNQSPTKGISK